MTITFQATNFTAQKTLQDFAEKKVSKLAHLNTSLIRADISLKTGSPNTAKNKWCLLYISLPGENLIVRKRTESFEASVLKAVDVMEKILSRSKAR